LINQIDQEGGRQRIVGQFQHGQPIQITGRFASEALAEAG
jgi:hypothetical protein